MIRATALRPLLASTALLAASAALAQPSAQPAATPVDAGRTEGSGLRSNDALIKLEYQSIAVPGDHPIDLASFHVFNKVLDGVYLGAGFYAPLLKGAYGGFVAADLGVHLKQPLAGPLFMTAGLSAGGGGGGRNIEHSKLLSGSGGFTRGYLGLGYDFGSFALGATISKLKFRQAIIDGTQASVFLEMPFSYLTGPFSGHEQPLPPEDDRRAAREMGENMLTLTADNYRQRSPQGSNKSTISLADLQYAHFFSADNYWFAALGMAYRGLPLYNQLLGGVGRRWKLSPELTLYGQLGIGSGGYAPDIIDTDAGLLIYPKLQAEYALTRDLGLAVSLGYMAAPKGSSRNQTFGLSLVHHLRSGGAGEGGGALPPASYQGLRLSVLQQTDYHLSYRDVDRSTVKMMGLQLDIPLSQRLYLPLQASGAYNAYLGYPGYAEILAGLGAQTLLKPDERWQGFGQLLAGANVHGKAVKANAGLRYLLNERLAFSVSAGRIEARSSTGGRFHADNIAFGLDYRFAIPTR